MLTAGMICEYNPLHLGHEYFLRRLRACGATHIAVVMSGNFVQRGDAAILSKWARTRQALQCGADLVVELPLPWAMAGAERFARGGVALLEALGADVIAFGSECGNLERLREASQALSSPQLREAMHESLQQGSTFAAARQTAVEKLYGGETAALLRGPNNILGIEYLKALGQTGSRMTPVTVKRRGSTHGAEETDGGYASSGQIRSLLRKGQNVSSLMPPTAYTVLREEMAANRAPANPLYAERAILSRLRCMEQSEFAALPDLSEGLENRIRSAARQAATLEELYRLAKTKRYPMARIRRIVLSAFLGLKADQVSGSPPYLRILGIGARGPEILHRATAKLPIFSRASDRTRLNPYAREIADLESRATDLYALCLPKAAPCGLDQTEKVITLPY